MQDRPLEPLARGRRGDLDHAAGVAGRHEIGPQRQRCGRLCARPSSRGRLRLHQVVDASAAAADLRLGRAHDVEPGDRPQQRRAAAIEHPARARDDRHRGTRPCPESDAGAPGARRAPPTLPTHREPAPRTRAHATAHAGSSASSSPYSFIDDPHPAALTAIRSTPLVSNTSINRRAKPRASSSRPACRASAPQHPCRAGAMTSHPSARQHIHRRGIDLGEHEALHAAGQQADPETRRADSRRTLGACGRSTTPTSRAAQAPGAHGRARATPATSVSGRTRGSPGRARRAARAPRASGSDTARG